MQSWQFCLLSVQLSCKATRRIMVHSLTALTHVFTAFFSLLPNKPPTKQATHWYSVIKSESKLKLKLKHTFYRKYLFRVIAFCFTISKITQYTWIKTIGFQSLSLIITFCCCCCFVTTSEHPHFNSWGYANPPIRYDLLTKSTLPFSPWIRNPGKNILITRKVQNLGQKNRWIRNPLQLQDPEIR